MIRFYDPTTLLAGAGMAASAASTGLSIVGQLQEGRAAQAEAEQRASDLRYQGVQNQIATQRAIRDEERRTEKALSRARAVAWAQGWGGGVNAQALQQEIAGESAIRIERAEQDLRTNRERLGLRERRTLQAGRAARQQARAGAIGAGIGGAASLLRQGARAYGRR